MNLKKRSEIKERNIQIDIIRTIGMFWIVAFWHLLGYCGVEVSNPFTYRITKLVLSSFVFVSGYLIGIRSFSDRRSVVKFYLVKISHAYIPFLFAILLSLIEYVICGKWLFEDGRTFLLSIFGLCPFVGKSVSTLWFIMMMFWFYALTPFIAKKNCIKSMLLRGGGCYSVLVFCYLLTSVIDDRIILYFPIYMFGLMWRYLEKTIKNKKKVISILFIVIFVIANQLYFMDIGNWITELILNLSGLVYIFFVSELLLRFRFMYKFFGFLGSVSSSLYLFHRQLFTAISEIFSIRVGHFKLLFAYPIALPLVLLLGVVLDYLLKYLCGIVDSRINIFFSGPSDTRQSKDGEKYIKLYD